MSSSRLGYYVISAGIVLQFFGLAGGSWMNDGGGEATFGGPSYALLIVGIGLTLAGTLIGTVGFASLTPANGDAPRLLPLAPLVILAAVSLGGGAFAIQAGDSSGGGQDVTAVTDCPEGTFWHDEMNHCMFLSVSATGEVIAPAATPVCPPGYLWQQDALSCRSASGEAVAGAGDPACPAGYFWHEPMLHCMSLSVVGPGGAAGDPFDCPEGTFWHEAMYHCMELVVGPAPEAGPDGTPVCPAGTFWHEAMFHCMSNVCPAGYQWDTVALVCRADAPPSATAPPGSTQPPPPSATAPPAATPGPTPVCPKGTFWHEEMNHCMPDEGLCPPGYDFNPATGYCAPPAGQETPAPPTATPPLDVTPTPTPECPPGFLWHEAMGHCMATTCPPGYEFNFEQFTCDRV